MRSGYNQSSSAKQEACAILSFSDAIGTRIKPPVNKEMQTTSINRRAYALIWQVKISPVLLQIVFQGIVLVARETYRGFFVKIDWYILNEVTK